MTKIFGTLGKLTGIFVDAFRYISNEKFLATFTTNNDQIREPTYLRTCQDNDRFGRRKAKNRHPQKAGTGFFKSDQLLLDDLGNTASANGTGAFADSETQTLIHSNRLDQDDGHVDVVARHDHLGALR